MEEFLASTEMIILTQAVLSVIANIACIDETHAKSLLAVYGYDKSY
jgi:hypothetical protein